MIGRLPEAAILLVLCFASNSSVRLVRIRQGQVTIDVGSWPSRLSNTVDLGFHRLDPYQWYQGKPLAIQKSIYHCVQRIDLGFKSAEPPRAWIDSWYLPDFENELIDKYGFGVSDFSISEMRQYMRNLFTDRVFHCDPSVRVFVELYWKIASRGYVWNMDLMYSKFFKWVTAFHFVKQCVDNANLLLGVDMSLFGLTILFMSVKQESRTRYLTLEDCCELLPGFNRAVHGYHNEFTDLVGIRKSICNLEKDILRATSWVMPHLDAFEVISVIFERLDIMSCRSKTKELHKAKAFALRVLVNIVFYHKAPGWSSIQRSVYEAIRSDGSLVALEGILRNVLVSDDFVFLRA